MRADLELGRLTAAREAAAQQLHWHLSKAAAFVLSGCNLDSSFEQEMLRAERARSEWYAAQDAIMRFDPSGSFSTPAPGISGAAAVDPSLIAWL